MMNEAKALLYLMRHDQHGQYDNPNRVTADYADRLEAIIRKYEEPTFAMEKEGAAVLWSMGPHTTFGEKARACFKAMMESEK